MTADGAVSPQPARHGRRMAVSDNSVLSVSLADGSSNPITLTHSDALFGLPLHGATLTAPVTSTLVLSGSGAAAGCHPEDFAHGDFLKGSVFLLQRGNCSFATKVLNAQTYGDARGVIVLDSFFLCGIDVEVCTECSGCEYGFEPAAPNCLCTLSVMSGDPNTVKDITIPAMMVTRHDGARLKTLAEMGRPLMASMSWDLPERNGAAEMSVSIPQCPLRHRPHPSLSSPPFPSFPPFVLLSLSLQDSMGRVSRRLHGSVPRGFCPLPSVPARCGSWKRPRETS